MYFNDCMIYVSGLETEPKLPPHLADSLYRLVLHSNLNPVKVRKLINN